MEINLLECKNQPEDLEIGDVIVFKCANEYDYYLLIYNHNNNDRYQILRLPSCTTSISFNNIKELIKEIQTFRNGWTLHEIIKSDELELKRI